MNVCKTCKTVKTKKNTKLDDIVSTSHKPLTLKNNGSQKKYQVLINLILKPTKFNRNCSIIEKSLVGRRIFYYAG